MDTDIQELQQKILLLENEVKDLKNIINLTIIEDNTDNYRRLLTPAEKQNVFNTIKLLVSSINGVDILQDDIVISTNGRIDLLTNVLTKKYSVWQRWYEENNNTSNP
jgi:hypothetical protein